MEHKTNTPKLTKKSIAKFTKQIATKFTDLDDFYLYIHILAYVAGFDKQGHIHFPSGNSILNFSNLDQYSIQRIKEFFPIQIKEISEKEKKYLCKYYLDLCLNFERPIEKKPENTDVFLDKLSLNNPIAITKEEDVYQVSFDGLSEESQRKYLDWAIERYFYKKLPVISSYLYEKLVELANPQSRQTIVDPNCGNGSIIVELLKNHSHLDLVIRGNVRDQIEWLLCHINLYVHGTFGEKNLDVEIEFPQDIGEFHKSFFEHKTGDNHSDFEYADISISVVPFRKDSSESESDSDFYPLTHSLKTNEYSYIERMLKTTSGKTIAVVPDSILFDSQSKFVREAYLASDLVEEVISLPESVFNESASIIVFNKNKVSDFYIKNEVEIVAKPYKALITFRNEILEEKVETSIVKSENNADLRVSSNGVTIEKTIDRLAELFSLNFPDLEEFKYLYVLAAISDTYSIDFLHYGAIISLQKFILDKSFHSNNIQREAIEYLIPTIIENAKHIKFTNKNWEDVVRYLAKTEPDVVQISQSDSADVDFPLIDKLDYPRLSYAGISEFTKIEIKQALSHPQYQFPTNQSESILIELSNPKPNQLIYHSDCGIGSLFIGFEKLYPKHQLKYHGWVEDKFSELLCNANLSRIGGINAWIYDSNPLTKSFIQDEASLEWKESNSDESFEFKGLVDIAIGVTSFKRFGFPEWQPDQLVSKKDLTEHEYILAEEMISTLNETGRAIVVVPDSFLFSNQVKSKAFRKKYLSLDLIERVIKLPDSTFEPHSSIKTSIIVFKKDKANKNIVFFDGTDDKFEETQINVDTIVSDNKGNLNPSRYALKEGKKVRSIFAHSQYPVKKIKDLVELSIWGRNPYSKIKSKDLSETLPFVRVKDLLSDSKNFELDLSKVERNVAFQKNSKIIDFNAILVSKIGTKLKPTKFNYEGKPLIIGSDVIALKMKESINIDYFVSQLRSRLVQIQVEMFSSGNIINRINKPDFLNIQIILPPIEEQQRQILEISGILEEKAIAQEKLEEAKEEIENIEYEVIAAISHNLNQKLGSIVEDYDTILRFLRRKEKKESLIDFEELLRPLRSNEPIENADTFEKVTIRLQNNLLDTTKTLKTTESILQKNKIDAEITNIVSFFKQEIKQNFEGSNFDITIKTSLRKLEVNLDKNAFKDAIRNLIENAKRHGFVEENRNYKIIFNLNRSVDSNGLEFAQVIYKNNGKPFPKGFTFEEYKRLASRAGKTKNTGIGGFFVNKVIELHNGKFNIISINENFSDEFRVQFEIILPLTD